MALVMQLSVPMEMVELRSHILDEIIARSKIHSTGMSHVHKALTLSEVRGEGSTGTFGLEPNMFMSRIKVYI
jgi:hypothetical protein